LFKPWQHRAAPSAKNPPKNTVSYAILRAGCRRLLRGLHFALQIREGDVMNELVGRIRAEFLEMPGLRLTVAQASRLWGLDEGACRHVIEVLVGTSFLRWTPGGMLARVGE
jgi:hypothetical protein